MKKLLWISWGAICLTLAIYFGYTLTLSEDKSEFLIGETTHGHFQIELACESCHTEPFGGDDILQNACLNCHEEELEAAHDSHPKKKFTDPREAYRLEIIDARYCISCHTEHKKDQTHPMGLTLPKDYCYHCHKEVGEERESHKDLPFDSCASAGCHNYHDNRALYESFLVENAGQPWLKAVATLPIPNNNAKEIKPAVTLTSSQYRESIAEHPTIATHWQATRHAQVGVDCGGCHTSTSSEWIEKPGLDQCKNCHEKEVSGFTFGKHGMRLAGAVSQALTAIAPHESTLQFNDDYLNVQHGCNSCHGAHEFDTKKAATESCLNCHADEHSVAFVDSPHGALWNKALKGEIPEENAVSCATCHMPRTKEGLSSQTTVFVQHNQNDNLRPNEKMIRPVCMNCHSLEFSIDALADPNLIKNNFSGSPGIHIESIDWATKRENKK